MPYAAPNGNVVALPLANLYTPPNGNVVPIPFADTLPFPAPIADTYAADFNGTLVVDAPGFLANDVLNAATVSLVNGEASVSVPASVVGSRVVDVAFLPTNFGAQSSAGGHTATGSSYAEFTHTFSKVAAKVTASAKKSGSKYVVTVKTNVTGKATVKVHGHSFSSSISGGKAKVSVPLSKLKNGKNVATVSVTGAKTKVTLKK